MRHPERIACFHLNQIGDLLFVLPALYNLRRRFPNARIVSVARPRCRELLLLSDLVDEVIERPPGSVGSDLRIVGRLRRERFDLVLVFSTSAAVWTLALLSGGRARVGFARLPGSLLLTRRVAWTPPPSTQNNLRLVEAIGCPVTKKDYVGLIHPRERDRAEADRILESIGVAPDEPVAVLSPEPSPGREIKRWTDEGFAQVADYLKAELGLSPVVVGTGDGDRICELSKHARSAVGRTSLSALAGLLHRSKLLVGIDSGVMHLAAAVGTPVIALFGPTDPLMTAPQGDGHRVVQVNLPCRPCSAKSCSLGRKCMLDITPHMVSLAAREAA